MNALWYMWMCCKEDDTDVRFLMTVHDSILTEKKKGLDMRKYYRAACQHVELTFNLPLSLEYEVTSGDTWQ